MNKLVDITTTKRWQNRSPIYHHAKLIYENTVQFGEDMADAALETIVPEELRGQVVALVNRWLEEDTRNESKGK